MRLSTGARRPPIRAIHASVRSPRPLPRFWRIDGRLRTAAALAAGTSTAGSSSASSEPPPNSPQLSETDGSSRSSEGGATLCR